MNTRILVVDDEHLIRKGIISILHQYEPQWEIMEAGDGRDAIVKTGIFQPQVILMDHTMKILDGTSASIVISKKYPSANIIMISNRMREEIITDRLPESVKGFVPKISADTGLIKAIRRALNGEFRLLRKTLKSTNQPKEKKRFQRDPLQKIFTPREAEIIEFMLKGYTSRQIADKLDISKRTVDHHRASLHSRTGTRTMIELIKFIMNVQSAES
ncbi:MAG: response regulator transcription factor [Bacteroidetes bacterium]|nr:response regulator transcription factor [Bacteroidota bacterium]